jgi:hypothetical protein
MSKAHDASSAHPSQTPRARIEPTLRPVALPALAAALRSVRREETTRKPAAPPAILRKEAIID